MPPPRVHPTALVEDGVVLGPGTSVWDNVHIRKNARIGAKCIIGEKTYVAYEVVIGDLVKINAVVYICAGVTIEDGVMISAHTVFTNDRFPRSTDPDLQDLQTSDPTEETLTTTVRRGTTIGAGAVIGPGVTLGEFSMIGMGSVVTRDVPPHGLAIGNPARVRGLVCRCGHPVLKLGADAELPVRGRFPCEKCHRVVELPHRTP
ncbi:MAG: N-acetyltransferase [Planctomycetes bacterium]|nr:N-acetyltransferase [Planctomycetota bacterium]